MQIQVKNVEQYMTSTVILDSISHTVKSLTKQQAYEKMAFRVSPSHIFINCIVWN